jgi:hypothetical protein
MVVAVTANVVTRLHPSWLDRAMIGWNAPAMGVPSAQPGTEPQGALGRRCGSSTLATSKTAETLLRAGWVPFLHFDQSISRNDIEVIGGMTAASPGCEPAIFNLLCSSPGASRARCRPWRWRRIAMEWRLPSALLARTR